MKWLIAVDIKGAGTPSVALQLVQIITANVAWLVAVLNALTPHLWNGLFWSTLVFSLLSIFAGTMLFVPVEWVLDFYLLKRGVYALHQAELAEQKAVIATKDSQIRQDTDDLFRSQQVIDELTVTIRKKDQTIGGLKYDLDDHKETLKSRDATIEMQLQEIARLRTGSRTS